MAEPAQYRASVVRADPYEVEYDNGVRLPRDGFASQDADIFEGQQRLPAAPMGGFGAGPMTADAGTGAEFNQAQQGLPQASDVTPTWGANAAAMGDRIAAPPRLAPMEGSQGLGAPTGAPPAGDAGFRAPTPEDFARYGQGEAPPVAMGGPGAAYGSQQPMQAQPMAGRGGGAVTRSNTTTSTQQGVPLDPALETDMSFNTARAQQAMADRAEAARGGAENMAGNRAFLDAQQQDLQRAAQAREAERAKTMQTADDEYRRAVTEFSAREVDPNRFYNERGTGGTIIAALAMGLGALSQSLTGGDNTAMQIIQSAIADDIEAQKADLQTAGNGLAPPGNILAEMRARFGDERAAELAAEAALLRRAQTQAEGLEASARAAGALPEGELQSALLAMEGDKVLAELRERSADHVTTQVQTQRSSGGGGGAARRPAASIEIPGARIETPDRAAAIGDVERRAVATGVAGMRSLDQTLAEMERLHEAEGFALPGTDAAVRSEALRQRAIFALSQTTNSGIINPGELARYEAMIPDPTSMGVNVGGRLREVRRATRLAANEALRVHGYTIDLTDADAPAAPSTFRRAGQ